MIDLKELAEAAANDDLHWYLHEDIAETVGKAAVEIGQATTERDALQSTLDELSALYVALDERYGRLLKGLRFYANGRHIAFSPEAALYWEDVSGEPPNWLERDGSDHYEMIEDGTIAKMILRGEDQDWSQHDDGEPPPIEGELLMTKNRE